MSSVDLYTKFTKGGILNTNFFNGRLLVAEDLTALQTAGAQQRQQLARALGDGVAYGLQVSLAPSSTPNAPVVRVTKGLAFNRNGQAAAVSLDFVDVALVITPDTPAADAGMFAECPPPQPFQQLTNLGLYVFTVQPSSDYQDRVTMVELNSSGMGSSCGSKYVAEGVQFRFDPLQVTSGDSSTVRGQVAALAAQLDPLLAQLANLSGAAQSAFALTIAPMLSKFRNLVAHLCFGTDTLARFPINIFPGASGTPFPANYSVLDDMRAAGLLTDCEVPLALVYWTSSGLVFLDDWAVRRTLIPPAASAKWAPLLSPRRIAEGLAIFLQFQKQVEDLRSNLPLTQLSSALGTDYFRFLPAAGFLPIGSISSSAGLDYVQFLKNNTYRNPVHAEGAVLDSLFLQSLAFPPVDLNSQEMVWLYWVRQNMQFVVTSPANPSQQYMVLTNGHIEFQGCARYDLNYWDFANYD
jgi:hypothetical protein